MKTSFWFRRLARVCALAVLFDVAGANRADSANDIADATEPLTEGVPQVAVARLRALLLTDLAEPVHRAATVKLAQALIAAEQGDEALTVLADPKLQGQAETKFLQAQAQASLAHWAEALAAYQDCAGDAASPFRNEALIGQTEALRGLGRIDEALKALSTLAEDQRFGVRARFRMVELLFEKGDLATAAPLLKSTRPKTLAERKQRRFLDGCLELHQHNPHRAIELLTSILKASQGATRAVIVATLYAVADANLQAGSPGSGAAPLEDFIEHYPNDPALPTIFAKLEQLYAAEPKQARHELPRWTNDAQQPRRGLAQWYLARAELQLRRPELAVQAFEQLRATRPDLALFAQPLLEYAELKLADGKPDDAIAVLDAARALKPSAAMLTRINFTSGRAQYAAERFNVAAQTFEQIAQAQTSIASDAIHNASLAWLQAGDNARAMAATDADPKSRGELILEQGLAQAAKADPQAVATLNGFVRDFPQHERAAEAFVALAELAFQATPPRMDEARQALTSAARAHPTDGAAERAEYLTIWIEDAAAPNSDDKVITLANAFLQKRAASPMAHDVRLKLAETYYRRQDFASAQTQFELLARGNADSPEAEKAQYFAAESAMQKMGAGSLDRALILFDAVVKRGGDLKWPARNEQAVIERKLGKPQDALTLYDEVMRGDARPPEKRAALCGKADILFELGAVDPQNYHDAIGLYDQLAAQKGVPPHWRNEALFKKGVCLEKLQAPADALATFYTIVEGDNQAGGQREYFWFYKAGFNAARLLEEASKWQPAAAIYEKLAFAGGGRSEEAKSRLNRLRLEHFLWDQ